MESMSAISRFSKAARVLENERKESEFYLSLMASRGISNDTADLLAVAVQTLLYCS
jgi:hypothetical protein